MNKPISQTERLARIEVEQENSNKRLDKGDIFFEAMMKMIHEIEARLKEDIAEIKTSVAELNAIANVLKNPWLLGFIAIALVFAGVGLTLSVMLGVDVTGRISDIRNVTK